MNEVFAAALMVSSVGPAPGAWAFRFRFFSGDEGIAMLYYTAMQAKVCVVFRIREKAHFTHLDFL